MLDQVAGEIENYDASRVRAIEQREAGLVDEARQTLAEAAASSTNPQRIERYKQMLQTLEP